MIWLVGSLAVAYAGLHGLRLVLAWRHLRAAPDVMPAPSVILQPILSGDPDLPRTLAANVGHAPEARFVWLVDEDDAEGQRIARDLAGPTVRVQVLAPPGDGENPKLKKLVAGAEGIGAPIVVLDDDTVLRPGGAARLAGLAVVGQGLATAIPVWGRPPRTAAEALVAGFINGQGVSTYFSMSALGRNETINGMAYAIPADVLGALGGFAAAGHEVTDDWAVARLVRRGDRPLIQTVEPAEVAVTLDSLPQGFALLRRWMLFAHRYMSATVDVPMMALVLIPGLLPLLGALASLWVHPVALGLWLALLAGRAALHDRLVRAVAGPDIGSHILATVIADLLLPVFSLLALWRPNRLRWRSRDITLDAGSIRFR